MKIDRLWIITRTSVKKNKLKTIILLSFLIVSLTLSCLLIGFSLPMQNAIENNVNNSIVNRSGMIMFDDETYNSSQDDKDEIISEIENLPHITDVYLSNGVQFTTVGIQNESAEIMLQAPFKETELIIKEGRNVLPDEKNAVVLPEYIFAQKEGGNGKIKHETADFVGQSIDFELNNGSTYKAKVVGTYATNDLLYQENTAYISHADIMNFDIEEPFYVFEVDNYKNTEDVFNSIEAVSSKIIAFQLMEIDGSFLENVMFIQISLLLSLFILIITMITVKVFISSFIKAKIPELALLKSFGYNNKQLFKMLTFEYGAILLISLIISVIMSICLSLIVVNPILISNLQYTPLNITISFNPLIYLAIFVVIFSMICLSCHLELRKTKKFNIFRLLY